jgi:uncharacterized protein
MSLSHRVRCRLNNVPLTEPTAHANSPQRILKSSLWISLGTSMGQFFVPGPRLVLSVIVLSSGLTGCGSLPRSAHPGMTFEESLIFHPRPFSDGRWPAADPNIEEATFQTPDGLRLNGWFAEAKQPRAVVLFAEGNAGNLTSRRWVLDLFRNQLGTSVLIFDYRGYGKSEGSPTEAGILTDARAARRWLAQRAGVAEKDIVLVGESLGGGVAVDLAARDGARGLILQNTFSSLPDVAASHVRIVPIRRLMTTRLDSQAKIRDYHGPLLQTHGDADQVVPFSLGYRLFEAANEPKQFVRVPGGGHNDPPSREYLEALNRFLGSLPAAGEPRAALAPRTSRDSVQFTQPRS